MEHDPIIAAARQELAGLDSKRREIEDFISRYERYKAHATTAPSDGIIPPIDVPLNLRGAPADKVMSAVHDILFQRGDALTLSAIFDELTRRGVIVGGKHPKQNLSQKLSAHQDLRSYGKRGWYFADRVPPCLQPRRLSDCEEAEYEEGPDTEVTRPLHSNGATDPYTLAGH